MKTPAEFSTNSFTTTAGISPCTPVHKRAWSAIRLSTVLALTLFSSGLVRASQSASLAWSPVTNSVAAGYACYFGRTSGVYTSRFDVGTNTDITLSGLKEGTTNYFAVTSYNSAGLEAPVSAPVSYLVPGLVRFTLPTQRGGSPTVSFPAAVGHWYQLQASTNLLAWTNLWQSTVSTSNAWITYQDPASTGKFSRRFYRLIMN
jgi:hypothetical protein